MIFLFIMCAVKVSLAFLIFFLSLFNATFFFFLSLSLNFLQCVICLVIRVL